MAVLRRLLHATVRSRPLVEPAKPEPSILDRYVSSAPAAQNAVDIFVGEWSSSFPEPLREVAAGSIGLFEDSRVDWAIEQFGGVDGATVLELGPLEGGHTYRLTRAGATVTAIEAQTTAYLKCLVAKELLGIPNSRFLLGDFMRYLRDEPEHVDVCFASGVLYHMRSPVETIALMSQVAEKLFLWTHVYDEAVIRASELLSPRFTRSVPAAYEGFEHTLYRFDYAESLEDKGFCGGGAAFSNWLTRADLLAALDRFGWQVGAIGFDEPDHVHGPALALVATRKH